MYIFGILCQLGEGSLQQTLKEKTRTFQGNPLKNLLPSPLQKRGYLRMPWAASCLPSCTLGEGAPISNLPTLLSTLGSGVTDLETRDLGARINYRACTQRKEQNCMHSAWKVACQAHRCAGIDDSQVENWQELWKMYGWEGEILRTLVRLLI